jgi:hypothetical protein
VTAAVSPCRERAGSCGARGESAVSSIRIVNDDDSTTRAGNPGRPHFKFKLSIM